jgi:hypothetical protein
MTHLPTIDPDLLVAVTGGKQLSDEQAAELGPRGPRWPIFDMFPPAPAPDLHQIPGPKTSGG